MSLGDGDIAFALDLFADLGPLTHRKMFGGMCLYCDGTVFALQSSDGRLYLKTRDPEGIFGIRTDQFHRMPYYAIPESALDEPAIACAQASKALSSLQIG